MNSYSYPQTPRTPPSRLDADFRGSRIASRYEMRGDRSCVLTESAGGSGHSSSTVRKKPNGRAYRQGDRSDAKEYIGGRRQHIRKADGIKCSSCRWYQDHQDHNQIGPHRTPLRCRIPPYHLNTRAKESPKCRPITQLRLQGLLRGNRATICVISSRFYRNIHHFKRLRKSSSKPYTPFWSRMPSNDMVSLRSHSTRIMRSTMPPVVVT
jgi:hypothetical protein